MATTQERIERVLLKFDIDRASLANVQKGAKSIQGYLEETKKAALTSTQVMDKLNQEFAQLGRQQAIQKIVADFRQLPPQLGGARKGLVQLTDQLAAIGASEAEIKRVARALGEVEKAATGTTSGGGRGGGGRRQSNAVTRFGADIRALPAIPIPNSNLSTDVFGKAIAILGGLNPVMLGVIAAGVGLVVGLQNMTKGITDFTKAVIASQEEVYRFLKTGTREQVAAAIEAKKLELEIARARIEENKRILTQFEGQVGGVGRAIADALDLGGAQALRVETQKLEEEERALAVGLDRLGAVMNSNEVAARSAEEAEKKLAEARKEAAEEALKAAQALLDANTNTQIDTLLKAQKMTGNQARTRLAEIELEQQVLRQFANASGQSEENAKRLNERLMALGQEFLTLQGSLGQIDARDQVRSFVEAIAALPELFKKVAEAQKDIRDLTDNYNRRITEINRDRFDKEIEAARDRDRAIAEAQRDAAFDLAENARKAALDRLKVEENYQESLRNIQRQFNRDSTTAVAERDALAFFQAQQRRDDELREARESRQESLRDIDRQLQEQNRQVNIRLAEQTRIATERYNEQLRVAALAAQKAIQQETERYQRELFIKQQALSQLLTIERTGSAATLQAHAVYWQGAIKLAGNAISSIFKLTPVAAGVPASSGGGGSGPSFSNKSLSSFDSGGVITKSGVAMVHAGEVFANPRRGQSLGGVAINVNGTSLDGTLSAVRKALIKAGYQ